MPSNFCIFDATFFTSAPPLRGASSLKRLGEFRRGDAPLRRTRIYVTAPTTQPYFDIERRGRPCRPAFRRVISFRGSIATHTWPPADTCCEGRKQRKPLPIRRHTQLPESIEHRYPAPPRLTSLAPSVEPWLRCRASHARRLWSSASPARWQQVSANTHPTSDQLDGENGGSSRIQKGRSRPPAWPRTMPQTRSPEPQIGYITAARQQQVHGGSR